ncbi:MAG TPA: serine/threonine-protein kinase [Polyangiaceae bacterium]|nr:serine/threonine-protein kinase [Polyangiaceae bacterium]
MPKPRPREGPPLGEPVRFGTYLLLKRIAVGGMSEVYLARSTQSAAPIGELVIKRLLPSVLDDPRSRKTFQMEANLHTAARHPNVVEMYESGEVEGEPYLAMEYVPGVDAFRLMRRTQSETTRIPPGVGIYIARELCKALACVHALVDEDANPLGIVHRDVTPSNIYLSETGEVKLGDFGIARSFAEKPRAQGTHVLKGKYGYLAPEQVSGEPFDHRADLFSLAVVLAEMMIGQALFPGAGQLAVLLAIRDCRIDPLRASMGLLPKGLFPVLEKALAKAPDDRFSSASEFYDALAPYETPDQGTIAGELATLVKWAGDASTLAKRIEGALRESTKMSVPRPGSGTMGTPAPRPVERLTAPPPAMATVRTQDGRVLNDISFAKLVEFTVTGELGAQDEVAMAGQNFQRLETIDVLARHLPPSTATTSRLDGPGVPDYAAELGSTSMLDVLTWLLIRRETGALFADRPSIPTRRPIPLGATVATSMRESGFGPVRKELYFENGRLVLVASTEPSELLGEHLVRRGAIQRSELEAALLELPRYDGRLGDTLIGLGLVDAVEVFRAIESQGRARVAAIFRWSVGRVSFYRGVKPHRVDFRLDLDIPELMLAGLEESVPNPAMIDRHRGEMETMLNPVRPPPHYAMSVAWPPSVLLLMGTLGAGRKLGDILATLKATRNMGSPEVLRAIEITIAGGLVRRATR